MPPKKPIPIRRKRSSVSLRANALERLKQRYESENEDEFDPSGEVVVTPFLKSAEGGWDRVLEALRAHDDDDARDFLDVYDSVSVQDRKLLKLEEISAAAGITSLRLSEVANSAMILYGQMSAKMILASSLASIVKTSVRLAKTQKGQFDREMMLKAGGVLPVPKGAQIAINNGVVNEKPDTGPSETPAYLDAGQRLRMIHDAVDQRKLPSPASQPFELHGRLDHMQAETAEIIGSSDV